MVICDACHYGKGISEGEWRCVRGKLPRRVIASDLPIRPNSIILLPEWCPTRAENRGKNND